MLTGPNRVLPVSPSSGTGDPLSALMAGRVVEARLSLALGDGLFRFASPGGEIDLPLPQALAQGTRVAISAQPGGGFQVAVLAADVPPSGTPRPPPQSQAQAGQTLTLPPLDLVVTPKNGDAGLPPLGRNVAAQVIANPEPGIVRVQAPGGEVDLPLPRAVPEGTVIRVTAQRGGAAQVHVPAQSIAVPSAPSASPAATSLPPLSVFTARPAGNAPVIEPGRVVEAKIVSATPDGTVRVAAREGVFDLPIGKALPPGTQVRIAAQPGGSLVMTVRTDSAAGARAAPQPILVPPGPQVPSFAPGTTLTAHVTAATESGAVRFTTPLGSFQMPVGQPLMPGTNVQIAVQANGGLLLTPEASDIAARPPAPATPAQAVQQNMRMAVARQDAMAPLFADLEELPGRTDLPRDVRQAAQSVLDRRLPLDLVTRPDQLARAVAASGLFAERSLSMPAGQKEAPPDLKLALFVLRAALGSSGIRTDANARVEAHLPPPQAGASPAAQAPVVKSGQGAAQLPPEQILTRVASETDAGLARINLHQIASLPDEKAASLRADQPDLRWSCEVPVNVDGRTAMFGFVIERDGHRTPREQKKKNWRVRAALDLHETGAVEADVYLSGTNVAAGLLVERAETAELLEAALPMLRDGLTAAGFEVEALSVRIGKAATDAGPPGHFMDLRS